MNDTKQLYTALSISGASCQGCVKKIRAALASLTGDGDRVEVDLGRQTVALPSDIDLDDAARRVTDAGYPAKPLEGEDDSAPGRPPQMAGPPCHCPR